MTLIILFKSFKADKKEITESIQEELTNCQSSLEADVYMSVLVTAKSHKCLQSMSTA